VSRSLAPTAFGLVALAITISSLAAIIAPSGFGDAIVQRAEVGTEHLNTVFWLCTGAGALAVAISAAVSLPVANYLHEPLFLALLPAVSAKAIFDMAAVTPMAILARRMSFHLVAARTTIASVVAGAVCLGLLWAGWGLWALALSQVAGSAANSIGAFAAARWKPQLRFSPSAFHDLKRYGAFASGTRVLSLIYPDQLLIGFLLGPYALGIFTFSRRIFQLFNDLIAGALSSVAHSFFSSLQENDEKVKEAFLVVTYLSSGIAFAVFGGIAAIAQELIPTVFGPEWSDSLSPVRAFCVIGLLSSIGFVQAALINSKGHTKWWFYYLLLKQCVLLLTAVIASRWGVSAIVWAMAFSSFLVWPLTVFKSASISGLQVHKYILRFLAPAVACLLMFASVTLVMELLPFEHAWLRLFALISIGGAVYSAVLFLTSYRTVFAVTDMVRGRRQ
jgi:O-antigen/teichoic acid export membrane protein